jgi:O-antigen/teichoic acid export membrane protein
VRRSLFFSFVDKYGVYALMLVAMAVLGRLLTPQDFGLFAIGFAVVTLIDALRDFGIGNYLVQTPEIELKDVRLAFTLTLILSLIGAGLLLGTAAPLAEFYGEPGLRQMMPVLALNCLLLPFATPSMSMLRREMAFDRLAAASLLAGLANTAVVIGLAAAGFGFMSFAWAALATALVRTGASNWLRPVPGAFVPSLAGLRGIAVFGGYSTASAVINIIYDSLPQLIIGRVLGASIVGVFGRATTVCQLPDKLIIGAIQPVILPALSDYARRGSGLGEAYLLGLTYVSALQWPLLLCVALLANPLVLLLLGPQWVDVPHLVRIIALASLAMFPAFLTYPTLVAVGRIKDTLTLSLISLPPSIVVVFAASGFGIEWVAAAQFVNGPLQVGVAMWFVRRAIGVTWVDIAGAVRASAVVALCAAVAPAAAVILAGFRFDVSIPTMFLAGAGAVLGWLGGLVLTQHRLLGELLGAATFLRMRLRHRA